MFWKKKDRDAAPPTEEPSAARTPPRPTRPPVKGTKVRLFVHPPGRTSRLLEVDLPDDPATDGVALRCFEPPPDGGRSDPDSPTRAWVVDLDEEATRSLLEQAGRIRLLPLGAAARDGDGSTVELTLSSGPAEARLSWWMSAPSGWKAASELVETLRGLAGESP